MSGGPLVFHIGVVRVSLSEKVTQPSALDARPWVAIVEFRAHAEARINRHLVAC